MIQGTIESIAFGGQGILRHDGLVIFVPFTAPGDEAAIELTSKKKNYAEGKVVRLIKKSPQRTEPGCRYFGVCGGCQLQHLSYAAQLEAKKQFIADALKRIAKIDFPPIAIAPAAEQWHYRRHIKLKLKKEGDRFHAGYAECLPIDDCPIFDPTPLREILPDLSSEGIEEGSVRILKTEGRFVLAYQFPRFPLNHPICAEKVHGPVQGIVMQAGSEIKSWGNTHCEVDVLGIKAAFSPFGFVQNHPEQSRKLYEAVLNALPQKSAKVLDLYAGIGITSLLFAKAGKNVIAVESHAETVERAKENTALNQMSVQFLQGDADVLGPQELKSWRPDVVLCNPPRTGLGPALLQSLVKERPPHILYVSCMPATLARDLHSLAQAGYRVARIEAFDMFPQTTHVEALVHLSI